MARLLINMGYKNFMCPPTLSLDIMIPFLEGIVPVKKVSNYNQPDRYEKDDSIEKVELIIVKDDAMQVDENFWREKCAAEEKARQEEYNARWQMNREKQEAEKKLKEVQAELETTKALVQQVHEGVAKIEKDPERVPIDSEDED